MTGPVETTCPYCGVGCGVDVVGEGEGWRVCGSRAHPANRGRLCSKGSALGETLGLEGRLLHPHVHGARTAWDQALDAVADGLGATIAEHGPEAVAFYVSGQLLTEDYYVANKLMKGFIGSANIDTNSRLCMASTVAGHKRAFGADVVPGCYEDLDLADLIVLVGSNAAWCHPIVYQRIVQAKRARPQVRIVVIDPRATATCETADLHLALRPGSDVALFNGLLEFLRREDALDRAFLEAHTEDHAQALEAVRGFDVAAAARACGLDEAQLLQFYRAFAGTTHTVTLFSQGVNQSSCGTDKVNAILNVHLATGRIGRPGIGPLSLTGQPNAMGGREVGGLASTLAAHMDFEPAAIERLARFWQAPRPARAPGLKAVELFGAVERGEVKALWVMGTNPAFSLPDADRVQAALRACPLLIVSDCVRETDTTACADILLPAAGWGEKSGTVTSSERRISRKRAFRAPPGEARPDWWMLTQVARRLGYGAAFPYTHEAQIFREHARLSAFENGGTRAFDIGGLAELSDAGYETLPPRQWPITAAAPEGTARLFGEGRFFTPSGKARLTPVRPRPPAHEPDAQYPLVLNTGRLRDQWHSMTRTGTVPRLSAHTPEPCIEVHPCDADRLGLGGDALATLETRWGSLRARVAISGAQRPGSVFVPMHWSGQWASTGRVGALVNPATDPVSGQPESKHTPARLRPWRIAWRGVALARAPLDMGPVEHWVKVRGRVWRYELAGSAAPGDWRAFARAVLGCDDDWLEFADPGAGRYRAAVLRERRLHACLFVERDDALPTPEALAGLFGAGRIEGHGRLALLAGRDPAGPPRAGRTVCVCFGVGEAALAAAIREQGLGTAEAIGAALRAGTNCGSCLPEIGALIARLKEEEAA